MALEQGYDTPLGEGGSRLSSGQKQLIAIARALAGRPRILLLDEATSRIDSQTEQIVQQALDELRGKVTVIAIAHRLSTIRDADRIVVLNHGRISEAGTARGPDAHRGRLVPAAVFAAAAGSLNNIVKTVEINGTGGHIVDFSTTNTVHFDGKNHGRAGFLDCNKNIIV
jgi:ABC-type methionine transport system ATPase subunit